MTDRLPYVKWYPADYLSDYKTARLTLEEHGAYHLLLWHMWNDSDEHHTFPMDYTALGGIWRVCPEEATRLLDSLMAPGLGLLTVRTRHKEPRLTSTRLCKEATAARGLHDSQVQGGKEGARRKWEKYNRSALGNLSGNLKDTSSIPELDSDLDSESDITPSSYARGRIEAYLSDKGIEIDKELRDFIDRMLPAHSSAAITMWLGYAIDAGADSICGYARKGLEGEK